MSRKPWYLNDPHDSRDDQSEDDRELAREADNTADEYYQDSDNDDE